MQQTRRSVFLEIALLVLCAPSGAASQWTRSQGGQVVDLFELTPKGDGMLIAQREGIGKPVYASGFCTWSGNQVVCSVRGAASGKTGHIVMTPNGNTTRFRSWYSDGRLSWDGEFTLAQGALETAGRTNEGGTASPMAGSRWTRANGGMVVDQFELTPAGDGLSISLREGPGKPVYSSGFCTAAGPRVVCSVSGTNNGRSGQIALSRRGDVAHYRSWYADGTLSWDGEFTLAQGGGSPGSAQTAATGTRYRVENFVYGSPDAFQNPRNLHDFLVDFGACKVRGLNQASTEGKESIEVTVCRPGQRISFVVTQPQTRIEYDWVLREGGRVVSGAYRQGNTFGPSVGGEVGRP